MEPPCVSRIKRVPDRSEPWASGIRQANPFHLLPETICNYFTYYFEHRSQIERVRVQIYVQHVQSSQD
jgi:hypothetical protein